MSSNVSRINKFKTPFELLDHLMNPGSIFIDDPTVYKHLIFPVVSILSNCEDYIYLCDELNEYRYNDERTYSMLFHMLPKRKRYIKGPQKNERSRMVIQLSKLKNMSSEATYEMVYKLTDAQIRKEILRLEKMRK